MINRILVRICLMLSIALSACLMSFYVEAGNMTLTTYYPSPFGVYDRLRFMPRDMIADPISCDATVEGLIVNDSNFDTLRICSNGSWDPIRGVWTMVGDDIYPFDTATNPNLAIGIGTMTPEAPLHIQADNATAGGYTALITGTNDIGLELGSRSGQDQSYMQAVDTSIASGAARYLDLHMNPYGGRVGVGTLSPVADVQISSIDAQFTELMITNLEGAQNANWSLRSHNVIGAIDDGFSIFGGREGSEDYRLIITPDGDVGIGLGVTDTIDGVLHVRGPTEPVGLFERQIPGTNWAPSSFVLRSTSLNDMVDNFGTEMIFEIQDNGSGPHEIATIAGIRNGADDTGSLMFGTRTAGSWSHRMILTDSGVGIGTRTPVEDLHIYSEDTAGGSTTLRLEEATGSNAIVAEFQAMDESISPMGVESLSLVLEHYGSTFNYLTMGTQRIGVLNTNPATTLHVNGDVTAGAYFYSSDASLKKNIKTIMGLDMIKRLRGVNFVWQDSENEDIGLIAQEVESVFPELVMTDPATGLKSVKYANIVAPLIEAVKTLDEQNHQQKLFIEQQRIMIQDLQKNISQLMVDVEALKRFKN